MAEYLKDLVVRDEMGQDHCMAELMQRVTLIVNVDCKVGGESNNECPGLQALYLKYKERGFEILAFPCDQFQLGGKAHCTAADVKQDLAKRYHATFPIMHKVNVNGETAHPLFIFLQKRLSGFPNDAIKWDFTKFLIVDGEPTKRYAPTVSPQSIEVEIAHHLGVSPEGAQMQISSPIDGGQNAKAFTNQPWQQGYQPSGVEEVGTRQGLGDQGYQSQAPAISSEWQGEGVGSRQPLQSQQPQQWYGGGVGSDHLAYGGLGAQNQQGQGQSMLGKLSQGIEQLGLGSGQKSSDTQKQWQGEGESGWRGDGQSRAEQYREQFGTDSKPWGSNLQSEQLGGQQHGLGQPTEFEQQGFGQPSLQGMSGQGQYIESQQRAQDSLGGSSGLGKDLGSRQQEGQSTWLGEGGSSGLGKDLSSRKQEGQSTWLGEGGSSEQPGFYGESGRDLQRNVGGVESSSPYGSSGMQGQDLGQGVGSGTQGLRTSDLKYSSPDSQRMGVMSGPSYGQDVSPSIVPGSSSQQDQGRSQSQWYGDEQQKQVPAKVSNIVQSIEHGQNIDPSSTSLMGGDQQFQNRDSDWQQSQNRNSDWQQSQQSQPPSQQQQDIPRPQVKVSELVQAIESGSLTQGQSGDQTQGQ